MFAFGKLAYDKYEMLFSDLAESACQGKSDDLANQIWTMTR